MSKLLVELSLVPVDMGAKPEVQIVDLAFKNSKGVINVIGFSETTTTTNFKLKISNKNNNMVKRLLTFHPYTADFIFCISCSMANPIVLFSSLRWIYLPATIEEERPPGSPPRVYEGQKANVKRIQLKVDEAEVLNIMEKILQYRVSNKGQRSLLEKNIIESINNYQLALISPNIFPRFVFLFHAFEKAVNADKDRRGKDFIKHASKLTGFTESKIKELLEFYDRIKHVFRNTNDILTMENSIKNFSELALRLKKVTDNAILYRIGL